MKNFIITVVSIVSISINAQTLSDIKFNSAEIKKIPVLNFATFHMGKTSDANKTTFDEFDKKNQKEAQEIAKLLAAFKPTVILIEDIPENNEFRQKELQEYLKNQSLNFKNISEIHLIAFEVARITGIEKIFGIDHIMGYDYNSQFQKINAEKDPFIMRYFQHVHAQQSKMKNFNLLERLIVTNTNEALDFIYNINADLMTYVKDDPNLKGAETAAKMYERNLKIFQNINQLNLNENDRVFIISGSAHASFLKDVMQRSVKYKLVNTLDYLDVENTLKL
ncbi:DUF5694 domain-containing protein [Tenacibaculum sp. SG-28]|uniref:DUF5694 domain-containing protein n=1 Tax=Tenacibaculum sp. SG-28 TaxID=754426 RepID=UPI000CF492B3|nr:DUF5694 domain-containing protein [Tenacibaculum sp. SG-28]